MGILQSKIYGTQPDNKALPVSPQRNQKCGIQEEKNDPEATSAVESKIGNLPQEEQQQKSKQESSLDLLGDNKNEEDDGCMKTANGLINTDDAKITDKAKTGEVIVKDLTKTEDSVLIENEESIKTEEETEENSAFIDPRSPSANIERTPVAVQVEQQSSNSGPEVNITPLREKTSKTGDNLRRRALMKKVVIPTTSSSDQENQENAENPQVIERPSLNELPGTPKPSEMSLLANEMEKMGINSPAVTQS